MAMRIHDQHGNLITLILQDRKIIGGDISNTRVHYVGGAHVENLATLVNSGLGGEFRPIELHFELKLTPEGLMKNDTDLCHFDNPYLPDWLLGTRNADGSIILKDEHDTSCESIAQPSA